MSSDHTKTIVAWKSKIVSKEKIRPRTTGNNSPRLKWYCSGIRVEFKGSCLKENKVILL